MNILSVRGVSKYYGDHTALSKVSLEIGKGAIFGLLGPNGAGKTSLIRIINQITAPDEGEIFFEGEKLGPRHISAIGYLPEERGLYPKMKVGEQLVYLARLKDLDKKEAKERISYWMDRFQIASWWNKSVEELSKGMAQKVQFIATVIHNPRLLIFDEPFTGFDPVNTRLIKEEIRRLAKEGATVIFSTHRMESVEEICDEIALIHHGKKILEGPLATIKQDYRSNIYKAELTESKIPESLRSAELLESRTEGGHLKLRIAAKDANPNAVVSELTNYGHLVSFAEEIPSLNDIFIQKVES